MILQRPGGLGNIKVAELPGPGAPGAGEIAVRIRANSINFHDYVIASGRVPTAENRILLSDAAGEVIAAGAGVSEFAVGDSVVSTFQPQWLDGRPPRTGRFPVPGDTMEGYACEVAVAPATAFTRAPIGYDHMEAATLPCAALTAWRALVGDGGLFAGQSVLVQGTGGVSIFALQFAKSMGAVVIVTSSSDEKLEQAKALGADHCINYKTTPEWGKAAHKLTGGVDHVIEIGGAGTLPQSLEAAAFGGHISVIGVLAGIAGEIPTFAIMTKQLRLQGVTVGNRRQQQEMIAAINATGIRPVISDQFPIEALADAFRREESQRHFGKIVTETAG
jgi:NADPH:quinone reductase-like Zn-dependent oxidoreductase